ncbi:MAG: DUF4158 domain-containing protein [Betaproteobacteria bacterium]
MGANDGTGADPWRLTSADHALVLEKSRANRLVFALLLLFHRAHGRFPGKLTEIDAATVESVAQQLDVEASLDDRSATIGRTWKRHRAEIRALLGFREATVADAEALEVWLCDQVAAAGTDPEHLAGLLEARCRELLIEPPSSDRSRRIVRAAIHAHDERFCAGIWARLAPGMRARLDARCCALPTASPRIRRRARRLPCSCACAAVQAGRA